MVNIHKIFADNKFDKSYASKSRKQRIEFFLKLISKFEKPVRILDIGGTENFWKDSLIVNNNDYHVTLLNLKQQKITFHNFESIKGNTLDLENLKKNNYDIVFSNSVIEHLFNFENQKKWPAKL